MYDKGTRPMNNLAKAMQRVIDNPDSTAKPCYRIAGMRINLAKPDSANPGWLYVKDKDYKYLGKISPEGELKMGHIDSTRAESLRQAIANPEQAAMASGKVTGICCCCGRTLTNKLSIELGIGPICRGYYFPPADSIVDLGIDLLDEPLVPLQDQLPLTPRQLAKLEIEEIVYAYYRLEHPERLEVLTTILAGEITS